MQLPAKKSLGQNFLKSKEALRALVEAGDVQPTDTVLEVGPGKGVLTRELVQKAGKVIAVEKDARLIEHLNEQFKTEIAAGKLQIIEGDILEFDPTSLVSRKASSHSPQGEISLRPSITLHPNEAKSPFEGGAAGGGCYKIIANIPYYITGTFLQKFLESSHQPSKMVLMVQKEVAQRIVAKDPSTGRASGKESILSISVKAYGTPKYIMTVKAKYFSPQPKVDSAIILIDTISKENFKDISEEAFFKIVKAGFAHKRKMLINNLMGGALKGDKKHHQSEEGREREGSSRELSLPKRSATSFKAPADMRTIFTHCGIDEKARAEDLSLDQWKQLTVALQHSAAGQ